MLFASLKSHPEKIPDEIDAVELRLDLNPSLKNFSTTKPLIIKSNNPQDALSGHFFDCDWKNTPPANAKIICSRHMDHTPENLLRTFAELEQSMPAQIYKLATTAHSTLDALRMLIAVRKLTASGKKVIGLCMGELGQITRIASPITYTHLGDPTAPGQLSAHTLLSIYPHRHAQKWFGLVGDPIEQSPSHITHNPHCLFLKMRIQKHEFDEALSLIEQLPFHGLAVTIPHKGDPPINTYVRTPTGWNKHNTDGLGVLDVLQNVNNKRIAILGNGGASKGIAPIMRAHDAHVEIYDRTRIHNILPYDILINATPCGMLSTDCPIKLSQVLPNTTIFETICKPSETTLLKYAKKKNCCIHTGMELFIAQANRQFALWGINSRLS